MSRPIPQMQQQPPAGMARAPWEGSDLNGDPYVSSTYFIYEADAPAALNAAEATQYSFNIAGDSDFFWTKFSVFALVGGAATVRSLDQLAAVTLLLTNTKTGRQYMNNPVPLPNIAGNGQFPFILPQVVLWEAFATIQISLANEGNADYSNLQLSFIGVKAFTGNTKSP